KETISEAFKGIEKHLVANVYIIKGLLVVADILSCVILCDESIHCGCTACDCFLGLDANSLA
ncbi:hypothetical protein ACJX0J_040512, partial [Zea mays]